MIIDQKTCTFLDIMQINLQDDSGNEELKVLYFSSPHFNRSIHVFKEGFEQETLNYLAKKNEKILKHANKYTVRSICFR